MTRGVHKLTATTKHVGMDVPDEIGLPLIWARIKARLRVAESGCWEYTGYVLPTGYVQVSYHSQRTKAHHVVHMATKGPVPDGKVVMHSCDNRKCLNPDHLSLGTQSENIRDCVAKGRQASRRKTHCPRGHAYAEHAHYHTSPNAIQQASPWRACKMCGLIRYRRSAGWPAHLWEIPRTPKGQRPAFTNAKRLGFPKRPRNRKRDREALSTLANTVSFESAKT